MTEEPIQESAESVGETLPQELELPELPEAPAGTPEAPEAEPKKRHRGIFWGLGILLALSLAIVLLLRALSFEAHWENGRLLVSFFGAGSDHVSDAITGEQAQPQQEEIAPLASAATGTGVTLLLSHDAGE